ncbi:hypothetical protein sos41_10090 [Alphaproteobacteria bacterium SO-S41]|nr:hypothetical protein sos41_10090 [Alphaproteobacteria bacterium SO-S41]
MARRRSPPAAPPAPPPPVPEVQADAPPSFPLPVRPDLPVKAEVVLPSAPVPPPAPAPTPAPAPVQTATVAATPAPVPPASVDPNLILILLGAAVALAAFGAVFALLAWRRSATAADVTRAAAEFTRSSVTILANESRQTDRTLRDETSRMREEADQRGINLRGEVREQIGSVGDRLSAGLQGSRSAVETRMDAFADSQSKAAEQLRFEVGRSVASFGEGLKTDMAAFQGGTREALTGVEARIAALTEANEQRQNALRLAVEQRLEALRASNDQKLEQMRATVEEKLQGTLEKRLGESFALVSERLENVQRGLGEMQTLALGVGDLKKVLANVKDRGGWAEVQLGMMLENMLTRDQYDTNVLIDPASAERVEYAVRLPGQDTGGEVLLPIDAKFPKEDYERLIDATQGGDPAAIRTAQNDLARVIENEAKKISTKYVRPPGTTDFAVMYLPTEGLFAEALRQPGLAAKLQGTHRVTIAGPSTLTALLSALQMGFRTLAIQKRSGEVWRVLGEAKAEFEKYGGVLDKLKKQLDAAQKTVDDAGTRTRAIGRKLRTVEAIDGPAPLLELSAEDDSEPE